jgi:hypothetical protein
MVSMGDGSHGDFDSLKEVAVALGVDKITKRDIESGKYPQITIKGLEGVVEEVIDEPMRDEVVELTDEEFASYQLTEQDMSAITAINNRMEEIAGSLEPEDIAMYDQLNRIYAAIQCGAGNELPEDQFTILMDTLTGSYKQTEVVYDNPDDIEPPAPIDAGHMSIYDDANENPALTNIGTGTKQKLADTEVEYPEPGSFKDEKALKKFYKQLSDEQLDEWIELEGLKYKECEHPSINRMRKCMAIRELHFPTKPKANTKSKSKYSHFSTEQLVEMANKAGIPVKDSKGSDQILRMYTIMALREKGLIS